VLAVIAINLLVGVIAGLVLPAGELDTPAGTDLAEELTSPLNILLILTQYSSLPPFQKNCSSASIFNPAWYTTCLWDGPSLFKRCSLVRFICHSILFDLAIHGRSPWRVSSQ